MRIRYLFLCFTMLFVLSGSIAQPCYTDIRDKGMTLMSQGKFREAIDKFLAARHCDDKPSEDDLDNLVKQAQDAWVEALEQAKKEAQDARKKADAARKKAEDLARKGALLQQTLSLEDVHNFLLENGGKYMQVGDFRNALTYYALAQFLTDDDMVPVMIDLASSGQQANQFFWNGQLDSAEVVYEGIGNFIFESTGSNFAFEQLEKIKGSRRLFETVMGNRSIAEVEALDFSTLFFDKKPARLYAMPAQIGKALNLKSLNLNNSQLHSLPYDMAKLQQLQELRMNGNLLTVIPPALYELVNLKTLELNANRISGMLPFGIRHWGNLEILQLNDNQINLLPNEIGALQNLKVLHLANNKLEFLSDQVGRLKNLEELDLSGNRLGILPHQIGNLTQLKRLYLGRTRTFFPIDSEVGYVQTSMIAAAKSDDNRLSSLPNTIGQLISLEELNLSFNSLKKLPETIKNLKNLRRLDLTGNFMEEATVAEIRQWLPNCEVTFHKVIRHFSNMPAVGN